MSEMFNGYMGAMASILEGFGLWVFVGVGAVFLLAAIFGWEWFYTPAHDTLANNNILAFVYDSFGMNDCRLVCGISAFIITSVFLVLIYL